MRWTDGKLHSVAHDNRQSNQALASYTFYKDGSTYYGEANAPGLSDITPNTSGPTVLQSICDALTNGGVIFCKSGDLTIDSLVTVTTPVEIVGEMSSPQYATVSGTRFVGAGNSMLKFTTRYVKLRNLRFYNNSSNGTNIQLDAGANTISNVYVENVISYKGAIGLEFNNVINGTFVNSTFYYQSDKGVYANPSTAANCLTFLNCRFMQASHYGLYAKGVGVVKIVGGSIEGNKENGAVFEGISGAPARNVVLQDIWLADNATDDATKYDIRFQGAYDIAEVTLRNLYVGRGVPNKNISFDLSAGAIYNVLLEELNIIDSGSINIEATSDVQEITMINCRLAGSTSIDTAVKVRRLGGTNSNVCLIATGTYTGDGAVSKAITGLGFTPIYVKIWEHQASQQARPIYEKSDTMESALCALHYHAANYHYVGSGNKIISLDVDGFTVSDNAANEHPNQDTKVYDYLALGTG